ncbi:hypothetical protein KC887_03445, partial [Candidatus Kaiserbacteria bacterium]|nr:hypothetical protein [Candidatus Kaiserbacteria bacterium]
MTDLKDIINKYSDYQTDSNDGQTASPATEFSNLSIYANNDQEEEQQPNQFIAGLKSGIDKTQALGYGLLGVAAKDTGNYQFAERAFEGYQKNLKEASTRGVRESSFLDLMGDEKPLTLERATDYAASLMGDLAPTAATIAIPGGIVARGARFAVRAGAGGAIPFVEEAIKRIALQQTGKLVNKGVAKDVAEKEALEFAKNHVTKKAAEYGMYAGSGAASSALETGGIAGDMYDQLGGINGVDSGTAILHGTAAGLLDSLPFIHVMRQMGIAGVARKEIINSIPKEILKTALAEGGTEAAQTIIERHAIKWLDDSKDIFTDEGWKDIIDSAAAGFFGGVVMGTPGAVMGKRAKPEDDDEIVNKLTEDADGPDPTKVNINRYQAFLDRAKGANDKRHATAAAAKQAEEDKKQFGIFTQRLNLDDQFGAYDDQEFRLNSIRAARESARAKGGDQLSQAIAGGEGLLLSLRNSQRSIEP